MTELTVLMPCLNEERSLAFCIAETRAYIESRGIEAEILIADNGSTDRSREIAVQNGARVITVEERGYGAALLGGIREARGKYVVMGDADGSYDFSSLDRFLAALREGNALVMGNRFRGGIEKGAMPPLHHLGVPALSFLARLRFRTSVGDFHCGLRAFDRETALSLDLHCKGMEFATEMIAAFATSGARIAEVPTPPRRDRRNRRSHIRTFRDGFRHLAFILTYKKKNKKER